MSYPPTEKEPECPFCREYGIPACCLAALTLHRANGLEHMIENKGKRE